MCSLTGTTKCNVYTTDPVMAVAVSQWSPRTRDMVRRALSSEFCEGDDFLLPDPDSFRVGD